MNIREEFDRLVETHRAAEDSIDYSDLSAVRGYLSEMLPIEKFLKSFEKSTKGDVDVEVQTVHGLLHDIEQAMKARACWNTLPPALYQVALRDMHRYV